VYVCVVCVTDTFLYFRISVSILMRQNEISKLLRLLKILNYGMYEVNLFVEYRANCMCRMSCDRVVPYAVCLLHLIYTYIFSAVL